MHTYYLKTKAIEWKIAKLVQIVDNILTNSWKDDFTALLYILLEIKAFHISTLFELD